MAGKNSFHRYSKGGHDTGGIGMTGVKGKHEQLPLEGDGTSLGFNPVLGKVSDGNADLISPEHVRAQLGKGCYDRGTKLHCKRPKYQKRKQGRMDTGGVLPSGPLEQAKYQNGPKGLSRNKEM